jgi:RNA polymerase sigma-70 factor, ECF subfamily
MTDDEFQILLDRAGKGDQAAWRMIDILYRDKLKRMVRFRMDPRLNARVDPSDVVQDAMTEASAALPQYLKERKFPFLVWLRFVTGSCLTKLHRYHLDTQRRDVKREVQSNPQALPEASSVMVAMDLLAATTDPSKDVELNDRRQRIVTALDQLDALDREVLVLRHFEHLSNIEAAATLGITQGAASKRYFKALEKLREVWFDDFDSERYSEPDKP